MAADDVYDPVNLGNPTEFTMKELAEEIARICNSSGKLRFLPLPADDPKQRRPDISRARKLLGWEPRIQLKEGLQKTVDYFASVIAK
jgi:UDP-glucuronate decarboxylase